MADKKRLLVFIVAYYAESTLRAVLDRIPRRLFDEYDTSILVVDDASEDRTFAIGREYQREHPELTITALRNEFNQGYGGNQKVGYAYAIAEGFDYVALLHGDGQYAPEELPRLVAPLRDGAAEAVFGSRMMTTFGALKGGMPLYKYVGNRILTSIQNGLLGSRLSEFHSGYRIYATAALRQLPIHLNSNDFHFDTEIIVQLLNARLRILEMPIPTYYGDEICRVNGLKYAKDVLVTTAKNAVHRSGLLYQRRFDPHVGQNAHYDLKLGYASSHSWALDAVRDGATVLDIGAGPGGLARELVRKGCAVTVVDQFEPQGTTDGIDVIVQDLDARLTFDPRGHEYILLLDVIEHLRDPELFLERLRKRFDHTSQRLVFSTGNVAFVVQRLMLLAGQFNYGKVGILDRTHTRLFTFRSARRLLLDAGFRIRSIRGVPAPFPKVLGNGWLGRACVWTNLMLIRLSKTLFAYQIFIEADSTPDVEFLLSDAKSRSAERAAGDSLSVARR